MAEPTETPVESARYDGRFGQRFDDEVSVSGVVWITVALAVACVLGMLITWGMQGYYTERAEAVEASPLAESDDRWIPEGPLLQRDPEGELEALRHEMAERLGGYGWVDEAAGVVHIPIDRAIDLLLERGSVAAAGAAPEPPAEEAAE